MGCKPAPKGAPITVRRREEFVLARDLPRPVANGARGRSRASTANPAGKATQRMAPVSAGGVPTSVPQASATWVLPTRPSAGYTFGWPSPHCARTLSAAGRANWAVTSGAGPIEFIGKAKAVTMADHQQQGGGTLVVGGPQEGAAARREQPFVTIASIPIGADGRQIEFQHAWGVGAVDRVRAPAARAAATSSVTGSTCAVCEVTWSMIAKRVRGVRPFSKADKIVVGSAGKGRATRRTTAPARAAT